MSEAVQETAVDAVSCKVYSVRNGYYSDAALLRLVPNTPAERKSPEIARGTWARVVATRNAIRQFLESNSGRTKVVANCGAGFDTGFWWAKEQNLLSGDDQWYDFDMEGVVRKKARRLRMPQ